MILTPSKHSRYFRWNVPIQIYFCNILESCNDKIVQRWSFQTFLQRELGLATVNMTFTDRMWRDWWSVDVWWSICQGRLVWSLWTLIVDFGLGFAVKRFVAAILVENIFRAPFDASSVPRSFLPLVPSICIRKTSLKNREISQWRSRNFFFGFFHTID